MKKTKQFLLAALLICSTSVFADDSFTWSGYMRGGQGYTTDMKDADAVKERGMENLLGRFGNEFDEQVLSTMTKKWTGPNGEYAKYSLELQVFDGDELHWNTNMVEFGGLSFLPEGSKMWAGQKSPFKEVDIFDYFTEQQDAGYGKPEWWNNTQGSGIGYQGKQLDVSLLTKTDDGTTQYDLGSGTIATKGKSTLNTLDIGYKIGDAGFGNGKVETRLTVSKESEDEVGTTTGYYGIDNDNTMDSSVSGMITYNSGKFLGALPGSTSYKLQIGKNVTSSSLNKNLIDNVDGKAARLIIDGRLYKFPKWQINPVFIAEMTDYGNAVYGTNGAETEKVIVAGVRAQNPLNNNISMVYEVVANSFTNKEGYEGIDGTSYKISAGPTIQLFANEWVRPVMRFTAAVVGGDKEITELDKDNEIRLGYEFETWF